MTVAADNVHPIQPHIDRKTGYEQQRRVAAQAVRTAATEVQRLAEFTTDYQRAKP